jgi:hypothetical protein
MRYAVYITRAEHWSFEARERRPISEREWRAYAESDPELRPFLWEMCIDPKTRKKDLRIRVDMTWEWIADPSSANPEQPRTFEYNRGGVIVRAPDPALLGKALAVARALSANLIADDDEVIGDSATG